MDMKKGILIALIVIVAIILLFIAFKPSQSIEKYNVSYSSVRITCLNVLKVIVLLCKNFLFLQVFLHPPVSPLAKGGKRGVVLVAAGAVLGNIHFLAVPNGVSFFCKF